MAYGLATRSGHRRELSVMYQLGPDTEAIERTERFYNIPVPPIPGYLYLLNHKAAEFEAAQSELCLAVRERRDIRRATQNISAQDDYEYYSLRLDAADKRVRLAKEWYDRSFARYQQVRRRVWRID